MAEHKIVICDRCGKKIEYGFIAKTNFIKVKHGLLNRSCFAELDLCKECQRSLEKWFEENKT